MRTLTIALLISAAALAQQPTAARIQNAKLESRATGGNLVREFQSMVANQNEPAWIGYVVPLVEGNRQMCCWNCNNGNCCNGCTLEPTRDGVAFAPTTTGVPVKLEGAKEMTILFRVRLHAVERIRTFTEDCPVDAGGLTVTLFSGVSVDQSIALLSTFVDANDRDSRSRMENAIQAIAVHAGPAADQALEGYAAASQPELIRERATFWLGNARGARGFVTLKRLAEQDPSDAVRDKVTSAVAQSKEPGAVPLLISMAKNDKAVRVRSQALFWLAQKAGRNAIATIDDSIANDPDTQVKKKAVFALSQLPKDDSVTKLIQVARTNSNPMIRKEAMFWLGQTKDPRAVAYFEEVLAK